MTAETTKAWDRPTFFDEGLRFSCTGCGQCCTGAPGIIFVDDDQARKIADHLGVTKAWFLRRYAYRYGKGYSLKERENGDCIFLRGVKCGIYEVRPRQCRTYPFWVENVRSPEAWKKAAAECPGIGQGELHDKKTILRRVQEALDGCEDV